MGNESCSKTHNIYQIDQKYFSDIFETCEFDQEKIIQQIMKESDEPYTLQAINQDFDLQGYNIKFYFLEKPNHSTDLMKFCEPFVQTGERIFLTSPVMVSSIIFIWKNNQIFAIPTGQGFRVVEKYSNNEFGFSVASGLKDDLKITATSTRPMSGNIGAQFTSYIRASDFESIANVGNFYSNLKGSFKCRNLAEALFCEKEKQKKDISLSAKKSIQFGSAYSMKTLLKVLDFLESSDFCGTNDAFNSLAKISNSDKYQMGLCIDGVAEKLIETLEKSNSFGFSLSHEDFYLYLSLRHFFDFSGAGRFKGCQFEFSDEEEFLHKIISEYQDSLDIELIKNLLTHGEIKSCRDGDILLCDSVLNHISGEIEIDDKVFLIFNGGFFQATSGYLHRINLALERKIRTLKVVDNNVFPIYGSQGSEDEYNEKMARDFGFYLAHRCLVDGTEFADLIRFKDDYMEIVHVKKNFDATMRILIQQIQLSEKHFSDLMSGVNSDYFESLYQEILDRSYRDFKNVSFGEDFKTKEDFLQKIKKSKPRYFAVILTNDTPIVEKKSNIAKHCLYQLINWSHEEGIDLYFNTVS